MEGKGTQTGYLTDRSKRGEIRILHTGSYSMLTQQKTAEGCTTKKVWDIDALKCPECGGQMKVISFIEQPSVIRRILKHLDLWEDPRPPLQPLDLVCEPCADYVPWQDDVPEIEVG